jgi:hypothetical protein
MRMYVDMVYICMGQLGNYFSLLSSIDAMLRTNNLFQLHTNPDHHNQW